MAHRKELNGIAAGLAGSFSSRNNDVDGYWALGILYKLTLDKGTNFYSLDLLSGISSPKYKYSRNIAEPYLNYLKEQAIKKGFEESQVIQATIEIEFGVLPDRVQYVFNQTWGSLFICRVKITDDLGVIHLREQHGRCGEHDPNRESRSTRRYAL